MSDDPKPYPVPLSVGRIRYRVAQIALAIDNRPQPSPYLIALHNCDNPACVRAAHLRWGTRLDNIKDYIQRRPGKAALQEHEVREIRASNLRNVDLAQRYGVSQSCICNVRKGVTHRHVK
jgi:hypothetical protein